MDEKTLKVYEAMSKDEEFIKKTKEKYGENVSLEDSKKEIIAYAKNMGVELTEEDLDEKDMKDVSLDELDSVAGGGRCYCFLGGFGLYKDIECICIGHGNGIGILGKEGRCDCPTVGEGISHDPYQLATQVVGQRHA